MFIIGYWQHRYCLHATCLSSDGSCGCVNAQMYLFLSAHKHKMAAMHNLRSFGTSLAHVLEC